VPSIYRAGLFKDTTILITGGGTGIGLACAREMGLLGARIAICGRREEVMLASAEHLEREGITVYAASCDIREPDSIEAYLDGLADRFGRLDVLVNNAGGQFPTTAETCSPKGFAAVIRNNLQGTWNVTHAAATRFMIPQKSGVILNMIAQVTRGFPGMVHTGAARAGVDNLTKTLAVEWAVHGIRVNAIAPGVIRSTGTQQYPPAMLEIARKATPMKRLGKPAEVSSLVTWLCSPASAFVTGQTWLIDGGQSLWGDVWQIPDDVPTAE
jgi:citronellol/citronellal dehydrogenase